jgi:hypothetical protein
MGWQMMEDRAYIAGSEIVRRSGRHPDDVIRAQAKWQKDLAEAGVVTQDSPTAQPTYKRQPPPADEVPEQDAELLQSGQGTPLDETQKKVA